MIRLPTRWPLLAVLAVCAAASTSRPASALPKITIADGHFADSAGKPIDLRGVNLGNWLLIEPWMMGVRDDYLNNEYNVDELLQKRFGDEKLADLKKLWRENWITQSDFAAVHDFGFNAIRLPFNYLMIEDKQNLGHVRDGGYEWLDKAVAWAADNDLYVVLDMHAAPENQSKDNPSGRSGHNMLWKDPKAQDRFVSLWTDLAAHYAGRENVAAYDLVNEPWGEFNDAHAAVYAKTIDRCVKAVRGADPETPILIAALLGGNFRPFDDILNDPKGMESHGWTHIAFTDHYYPGLFGSEPTMASHARHVAGLKGQIEQMKKWNAPLVIGEMQVAFDSLQQPRLTRWYYDYYNRLGWAPFVWSWKLVKPEAGVQKDNWYCVTNAEAWTIDLRNDAYDEIVAKYKKLGTMRYVPDPELKAAMTADAADLEPFELPSLGATTRPTVRAAEGLGRRQGRRRRRRRVREGRRRRVRPRRRGQRHLRRRRRVPVPAPDDAAAVGRLHLADDGREVHRPVAVGKGGPDDPRRGQGGRAVRVRPRPAKRLGRDRRPRQGGRVDERAAVAKRADRRFADHDRAAAHRRPLRGGLRPRRRRRDAVDRFACGAEARRRRPRRLRRQQQRPRLPCRGGV